MSARLAPVRIAVVLALLVGLLVAAVSSPGSASAVTPTGLLPAGSTLLAGQSLSSPNSRFVLSMQGDGNLVIYDFFHRPMWASNTSGKGVSHLVVQTDGNLVIYNAKGATWNTRTKSAPGELAMQSDGNLILLNAAGAPTWASHTALPLGSTSNPNPTAVPATPANRSVLQVGDTLTSGQGISSPDGRYSAIMQPDGNFVVYGPFSNVMWMSNAGGRPGARLVLQGDGNLVEYSPANIPLFFTATSAGAVLVMQSDGHLVLYSSTYVPLWYVGAGSPSPAPKLNRGETLAVNQTLSSPSGAYRLVQQSDGNLVTYNRSNVAVWSSRTSGSPGATATLDSSGDFVVKDTTGANLFMSYTSSAAYLTLLDTGNLVVALGSGALVWASQGQVRPMPAFLSNAAVQTTVPPTSVSRYVRNVTGASSDVTYWYARGATDAAANASGHQYVSLLDIGAQTTTGVLLSAIAAYVSYPKLVLAMNAYVDGYASKRKANAPVVIALGTNNDSTSLSATIGRLWSRQVVNPVAVHAAGISGITIAGANDIEPGFRGSPSSTKAWLSGYLASTGQPFVFNGSADGCSWTVAVSHCNNGWTSMDLYQLSTGMAPGQMLSLPQIYNSTMPKQWKYISLTGIAYGQPKVNFGGALTERSACDIAGPCASPATATAWSNLWAQLISDPRTKPTTLPWATDLTIN
ncbi:D-mannose binding lectin [Frankineae bacterium MT45]|nr:D-mannose binding lectin [Frankineae bacterium MT45]